MQKFILAFCLLGLIFTAACKKDQSTEDREIIQQDLAAKGITTAIEDPSGIFYIITKEGTGSHPTLSNTVKVYYKGTLIDGTVFDGTQAGQPIEFPLTNLIEGWQIAIPLLKKGGAGTFWIPSELGYGSNGVGSIPANSVLVFDIELVDFK